MDASLVVVAHAWASSQPALASVVSFLAESGIALLPVALLVIWLRSASSAETREAVLVGVLAAVLALGIGMVLERVLNRPRPFVALGFAPLFPHVADSSFPSDHTLVGVALVGPLLRRAPRIGAWLFAWALLIGAARVAAGVHYPSDIAGSVVLALVVDAVAWILMGWLRPRLNWRKLNRRQRDAIAPGSRRGARRR